MAIKKYQIKPVQLKSASWVNKLRKENDFTNIGRIWECHVCHEINRLDNNEIFCTGCGKEWQPKIDTITNNY